VGKCAGFIFTHSHTYKPLLGLLIGSYVKCHASYTPLFTFPPRAFPRPLVPRGSSVAPQSTAGRCVVGVDVVEPFSSPSLTAEVGVEAQSTDWKWGKVELEGDAPARISRYGSKSCCCSFSRALFALAAARSRAVGGRFVGPEQEDPREDILFLIGDLQTTLND
jgi:hypothetical protein